MPTVTDHTQPNRRQIAAAQSFYTQMFAGVRVPLPSTYPSHAIIGCVDITGCMGQEEYRRLVLDATSPLENHAPWLWQCENPQMCVLFCLSMLCMWALRFACLVFYRHGRCLVWCHGVGCVANRLPSDAAQLRRSFKCDESRLVHLPASIFRSAQRKLTKVPLAWRPPQALVRAPPPPLPPPSAA